MIWTFQFPNTACRTWSNHVSCWRALLKLASLIPFGWYLFFHRSLFWYFLQIFVILSCFVPVLSVDHFRKVLRSCVQAGLQICGSISLFSGQNGSKWTKSVAHGSYSAANPQQHGSILNREFSALAEPGTKLIHRKNMRKYLWTPLNPGKLTTETAFFWHLSFFRHEKCEMSCRLAKVQRQN